MNKAESKYFNTAVRMDKAFLELLGSKDFEFITIKELCEKAGVNRSTFYLHYETLGDLLEESIQYMLDQFIEHMNLNYTEVVSRISTCPLDELYLLTPTYLEPYLNYIKENRRLFLTMIKNAKMFHLEDVYSRMFRHVFAPTMERFRVPEQDRSYRMAFYITGLMAIVTQWLNNDCAESVERMIEVMQSCVLPDRGINEIDKK